MVAGESNIILEQSLGVTILLKATDQLMKKIGKIPLSVRIVALMF